MLYAAVLIVRDRGHKNGLSYYSFGVLSVKFVSDEL